MPEIFTAYDAFFEEEDLPSLIMLMMESKNTTVAVTAKGEKAMLVKVMRTSMEEMLVKVMRTSTEEMLVKVMMVAVARAALQDVGAGSQVEAVLHNNMAACHLKLGHHQKACVAAAYEQKFKINQIVLQKMLR